MNMLESGRRLVLVVPLYDEESYVGWNVGGVREDAGGRHGTHEHLLAIDKDDKDQHSGLFTDLLPMLQCKAYVQAQRSLSLCICSIDHQ
jgi:hypothetical protein